jgi:phosphoesterase RecJ-like protein
LLHSQVWELIKNSHYITLISHINPDGDTLGGALSFYPWLKKMGKNVSVVNSTKELSNKYDFLPNFKKIKNSMPPKCDLLISFDCGSFDRLGIEKDNFKIINIDHHKTNTLYGDINIVDSSRASATLLALEILESNHPLTKDEAVCIYTGLVEDTGFFSFTNTDHKAFEAASKLISVGIKPAQISQNLKMRNSLAKTRLTALFINSIELLHDAEVAVGTITQEDFIKTGAIKSDSDHLVDVLRNLATVELAIMILENKNSEYKISLRSKNRIDVSTIAQSFGGGGHNRAAGFELLKTDLATIIEQIIQKAAL